MPALGGRQPASYTLTDATGEKSTVRLYTGEITAVSLPGLLSDLGALESAIAGLTLGVIHKRSWGEETIVSNALPNDNAAQRESKLLVQYQGDTTEKPYTLTIPTIDFDQLVFLPGGGDAVAFTAANGASQAVQDFVAAFEAVARAPDDDTETVTITGMRYVGRNS